MIGLCWIGVELVIDWGFFLILNVDQLIVNVDGPN